MPLYMRKPVTPEIVEAEQIGPGAQNHPQGSRPARPGEWVAINHSTGQQMTISNEEFVRDYVPLAIPSHLVAPAPGTGPEFQPAPEDVSPAEESFWTPDASAPAPAPQPGLGDVETTTPMNENLPGRPAPTPEVKPRIQSPEPITTESGQPLTEEQRRQEPPLSGDVGSPPVASPPPETSEVPDVLTP